MKHENNQNNLCPRCGSPIAIPNKDKAQKRDVTFRLMLTPSEREQLNQIASDAGQTASQYVRSAIFPKS